MRNGSDNCLEKLNNAIPYPVSSKFFKPVQLFFTNIWQKVKFWFTYIWTLYINTSMLISNNSNGLKYRQNLTNWIFWQKQSYYFIIFNNTFEWKINNKTKIQWQTNNKLYINIQFVIRTTTLSYLPETASFAKRNSCSSACILSLPSRSASSEVSISPDCWRRFLNRVTSACRRSFSRRRRLELADWSSDWK